MGAIGGSYSRGDETMTRADARATYRIAASQARSWAEWIAIAWALQDLGDDSPPKPAPRRDPTAAARAAKAARRAAR